jgi:outer membrane protein OmpA-like peptidoglycan-associated protein
MDGCEDSGPLSLDLVNGAIALNQPLNFLSKKAVLEDEAKAQLDAVAHLILARPDLIIVEVQVYTETGGDKDFNLRFSDARAQIIRLYLVEKGVPESRIQARGFGGDKPLIAGTDAAANEANRRVEFVILDRAE